jgi:hypothetical protein
LDKRVFGNFLKQPYVKHHLKMLLGSKMRKDIHQNLQIHDAVCWSDYSKELEVCGQEQCKTSAFGASNVTIQLIGQVYELLMLPPSCPTNLSFIQESLTFSKPNLDGGSNIQCYEIHIRDMPSETWYFYRKVDVRYLSQEPDIPTNIFGRLSGVFQVRIHARNLCGLGEGSELSVEVGGDLPFMPKERDEISAETFLQKYNTFLAEFFFCSDHNDSPKVSVHIYLTQYSCLCP